jgi:hypothetical protein
MAPRHAAKADRRRHVRIGVIAAGAVVVAAAVVAGFALAPTTVDVAAADAATHGPLQVQAITPSASVVSPDAPLRVVFNNPLSQGSPMPTVEPHVAGTWAHLAPNALSFRPTHPLTPGTTYVVVVPATTQATNGTLLHAQVVHRFRVATGSTLRLHQLLAQLNYLPLRFVPTGPFHPTSTAVQRGTFTWRWSGVPTELTALWQPNTYTVITKGAIMAFESDHGMATDGLAGPQVWDALLRAVAAHDVDKATYNYVKVSTGQPETLTLYVDMHPIYTTLVNTGISSRPTAIETDPVYLRYTSTTMSGTNPDGSHYSDPGIPWVSYFHGGEALHGYIRGSYGWPQSLGCVEMPYSNAHVVFPYTPIGTLVTVY